MIRSHPHPFPSARRPGRVLRGSPSDFGRDPRTVRRRITAIRALAPILAAISLLFAVAASAQIVTHHFDETQDYGFAHVPASTRSSHYPPTAGTGFDPGGNGIRIVHHQVGVYSIRFPGLTALAEHAGWQGGRGHVQVTAASPGAASHCKVAGWSDAVVDVLCFDPDGDLVDSAFQVMYLRPTPGTSYSFAYAWADDPTDPAYPAPVDYRYNFAGGDVDVSRFAVGHYQVRFQHFGLLGTSGGNVQVTAYGFGPERCQVDEWNGDYVAVRCFDPTGAPVDTRFNVLYGRPDAQQEGIAYAWADEPLLPSYTPYSTYAFPAGETFQVTRLDLGHYSIELPEVGAAANPNHVQVTPYGATPATCVVEDVTFAPGTTAEVRCYDSAGSALDTQLSVLVLDPPKTVWARDYSYAAIFDNGVGAPQVLSDASFNRGLGDIEVVRWAPGRYDVTFHGFERFVGAGHVQVSVRPATGRRVCVADAFTANRVSVDCTMMDGSPAPSAGFQVFFLKNSDDPRAVAYTWVGQPGLALHSPSPLVSHNPAGGPIGVERLSTGMHRVTWTGFEAMGTGGGNAQVSAYGTAAHCGVTSWNGNSMVVGCVGLDGLPQDTPFSAMLVRPEETDDAVAFAWENDPSVLLPSNYALPPYYAFNPGGEGAFAWRDGDELEAMFGSYRRRGIGDVAHLFTPYGTTDVFCGQSDDYDEQRSEVRCWNAAGSDVHPKMSALLIARHPAPEPGFVAMLGVGTGLVAALGRRRARGAARRPQ